MRNFLESIDWEAYKAQGTYGLLIALVAALLVLGVLKLSDVSRGGSSVTVAVFDVVKFANAQRALASTFVGKSENSTEAGTLLLTLSKKTKATIEKVAGAGTLVLVKQGVVTGSQIDITDAVLKELGLPTDVPTVDPVTYLSDVAPTMLMLPKREAAPAKTPSTADSSDKILP